MVIKLKSLPFPYCLREGAGGRVKKANMYRGNLFAYRISGHQELKL